MNKRLFRSARVGMPGAIIVTVVAFLGSDEAGCITRVVLPVDGGVNR
jgi:hypothetical protein